MSSEKKVTVAAVAKEANVSPATVSRVINQKYNLVTEATVSAVHQAMERLGYRIPPSAKQAVQTRPILLLNIPDNNLFYREVIQGALASANAHGCHLMVSYSPLDHGSLQNFIQMIRQVNISGLIVMNAVPADILLELNALIPVVQCSEFNHESSLPFVSIRDQKAAKEATEYLISRGRNKIAFINGPRIYKYSRERKQGFLDAMEEANLTVPRNWIVDLPEINYDIAYSAICQILHSDPLPNAFFTASDTLAAAVLKAANAFHYRVPQDIMVVGFDNTDLSMISTPSITTVNQPKFQEGFTSCEMLLTKINSPEVEISSIYLETELIVRETT